jgi:anaerobic selenocysteine-containing dehydrogenase
MDRILTARVSRRTFLRASAVGAICGVAVSARAETAKVPKQTVQYQPSPKGPAHCAACAYFQAPSNCNFVKGPISPSGWCMLFKPK